MHRKVYQLEMEEEFLDEEVIGIHTSSETHQIAFYLNQSIGARFVRTKKDLYYKKIKIPFIHFEWKDETMDLNCSLFSNKSLEEKDKQSLNSTALFDIPLRNEVSLITEFKTVDFFIKSTNSNIIETITRHLKSWSTISLVYAIPVDHLKTQLNSIFD
ncbi:MAG: IPExxxVDY family protein [Flavobacteriaceae bacterium]